MNKKRMQTAIELHKPVRHIFPRRRVVIKGLDDLWQADLVEMIPYARINKGMRYILMVIDTFSKFVWALPVHRKSGKDVTEAMEKILKGKRRPDNLQTDHGKEFYNPEFQELMKKYKINHYSTFSNMKANIVERVNRTIKNRMWQHFTFQGNYKWLTLLPRVVREYNQTIHRTTNMKPVQVTKDHEQELYDDVYKRMKLAMPVHFQVGDKVRISKLRKAFHKGYKPAWSSEIFTVSKIQRTNPTTYLLQDEDNEPIFGSFYREELQKAKYPDVYLGVKE